MTNAPSPRSTFPVATSARKIATAMSATMDENSYMLPHGVRSPRSRGRRPSRRARDAEAGHDHARGAGPAGRRGCGAARLRRRSSGTVAPPAIARVRAAAAWRSESAGGGARRRARAAGGLLAGEGQHRQGVEQHGDQEAAGRSAGPVRRRSRGVSWGWVGQRPGGRAGRARRARRTRPRRPRRRCGRARATSITVRPSPRRRLPDGAHPQPPAADEQRQAQPERPCRCRRAGRPACPGPG